MAENDIVQKIVIQADDQATPVLSRLAAQYQATFQQIQAAAQQAGLSVEQFGELSAKTQQQYLNLSQGLSLSGGVLKQAETAAVAAGKGVAGAGVAATEAAAGFSITRRELSAVSRAMREVSSDLSPVAGQLTALGRIGLTFGPAAVAIVAIGAAIGGIEAALYKFAGAAQETEKALDGLQKVSGKSIENLSSLQQVFAQGGTSAKKFAEEFANLTEEVAGAKQTNAIRNSSKEWVEWQNNISRVRHQFDDIAGGAKIVFSELTTLDTKVKAIKESLAELKDPQAQWLKLADIMKNLSSELDRAQIGKKLGLSPETIETLTLGSAKLRAMQDEVVRLGLTLSDFDKRDIKELTESQTRLGALWDALKEKMGALASPAFTSFFKGLAEGLREVSPELQRIAEQFGKLDFSAFGRGLARAAAEVVAWLGDIGEAIAKGDFSNAFTRLVDRMVPAVTQAGVVVTQALISGMLSAVKSGIDEFANAVSTELQLLPQRLFYDLMKNFEILKANVQHLFTGTPIEPPDTTKLDETWKKIRDDAYQTADEVKKTFSQPVDAPDTSKVDLSFDRLKDGASDTADSIQKMGDAGTQAGSSIAGADKEAAAAAREEEQANKNAEQAAKRAEEAANKAAQAAAAAAAAWRKANAAFFDPMTRQYNIQAYDTSNMPMASGGEVHGPGTSTSDSIFARLSAGEFVVRAAAVNRIGVGVLHAINNFRFPRFELGGLVPAPPAFAVGGAVVHTSPRVLNLMIEGRSFTGLSIPERTAQALERFAVHSQIASTGRKQSWRR